APLLTSGTGPVMTKKRDGPPQPPRDSQDDPNLQKAADHFQQAVHEALTSKHRSRQPKKRGSARRGRKRHGAASPPPPDPSDSPDPAIPKGFKLTQDALHWVGFDPDDKVLLISGPLKISAIGRDPRQDGYTLLLDLRNRDGNWHELLLPYDLLSG